MANLTQVARIIKSEVVLVTIGIISISVFALAIFGLLNRSKTPSTPPGTPWQDSIFPGFSTKEDVESMLGQPLNITEENEKLIYSYSSEVPTRNHSVYISQDKVEIIKEQITSQNRKNLSEFTQKYGSFDAKVFGYHGSFAPGHFWAKEGILVFAGQFDGNVVEIWYFKPTTLNNLLISYPELKLEEGRNF